MYYILYFPVPQCKNAFLPAKCSASGKPFLRFLHEMHRGCALPCKNTFLRTFCWTFLLCKNVQQNVYKYIFASNPWFAPSAKHFCNTIARSSMLYKRCCCVKTKSNILLTQVPSALEFFFIFILFLLKKLLSR